MLWEGVRKELLPPKSDVWAPLFWLPTPSSMLRAVSYGHSPVDIDLGEYFINLPLHEILQKVSAVDLTQFRDKVKARFPHLWTKLTETSSKEPKRVLAIWL